MDRLHHLHYMTHIAQTRLTNNNCVTDYVTHKLYNNK